MALGQFLKINNTAIPNPNPGTFSTNLNANEKQYTTENGILKVVPLRLERRSWKGEFNCSSVMKATLEGYCKLARVNCTVDNLSYSGTLRLDGDVTLVENSEYTDGTKGLWVVPFRFESF